MDKLVKVYLKDGKDNGCSSVSKFKDKKKKSFPNEMFAYFIVFMTNIRKTCTVWLCLSIATETTPSEFYCKHLFVGTRILILKFEFNLF